MKTSANFSIFFKIIFLGSKILLLNQVIFFFSEYEREELTTKIKSLSFEEEPKTVLQCAETNDEENEYEFVGKISIFTNIIVHKGQINPDRFHQYLRDTLPGVLDISCILIFSDGLRRRNKENFRDYAVCNQPECTLKFKFHGEISSFSTRVKVFRESASSNHTLPMSYELRGEQRRNLCQQLRSSKPSTVHKELVKNLDIKLAENEKNFKFCHSEKVLRTAKTSERNKNDRDTNDVTDMILRIDEADGDDPYIKTHVLPFSFYLGINEQVELLINNPNLIIHFDATGSTVRKPYKTSKRMYYCAGVVNIQKKIYPVLEMVSNKHTALSIAGCLDFFKNH